MIGRVRTELDQHVSDFSFRLFSTALEIDPRDVTDKYRAKLYSSEYAGEEWKLARELLRSVIQWTENTDFPRFDAREWQHYLVVEVRPDEVAVSDMTDDGEIRSLLFGSDDEQWDAKRRRMQREVKSRLSRLSRAFGSTDGCETTHVGPAEHALLLGRYWSGTEHSFDTDRVTKDIDAAVWPHTAEEGDSPRPEAVDATDTPRTGVADVATVEATTDGGTVSQPVATSTHADENADEDTSFLAQVREGLLAPLAAAKTDERPGSRPRSGTPRATNVRRSRRVRANGPTVLSDLLDCRLAGRTPREVPGADLHHARRGCRRLFGRASAGQAHD